MAKRLERAYPSVRAVSNAQHARMVREIFATIPERYDFLNRFLSLRRDVAWRRFAVRRMRFFQTGRFLDLATGTADLAIEAALRHPQIQVTGVDLVREMMDLGRAKVARVHLADRVRLLQGDALELPLGANRFDVAAIAFGIRNIPNRTEALREMARVVVSGGQVMVLEMNEPVNPLLKWSHRFYVGVVLPRVAGLVSRNPGAYRYLADSIVHFPDPPSFARLMVEAGLTEIRQYALNLGTVFLHVGIKAES